MRQWQESGTALHARLARCGLKLEAEEIFSSLSAARGLVERRGLRRPMLLLEESAREEFRLADEEIPHDAVVVGLSPPHFCYEKLTEAFQLLLDGAPLIAIHKARYFKRKDGLALGPGAFVSALEFSSGVKVPQSFLLPLVTYSDLRRRLWGSRSRVSSWQRWRE